MAKIATKQPVTITATKLLINNQWVDSSSEETFKTINPATEEVICEVAQADIKDVDLAVKAARKAFEAGEYGLHEYTEVKTVTLKL